MFLFFSYFYYSCLSFFSLFSTGRFLVFFFALFFAFALFCCKLSFCFYELIRLLYFYPTHASSLSTQNYICYISCTASKPYKTKLAFLKVWLDFRFTVDLDELREEIFCQRLFIHALRDSNLSQPGGRTRSFGASATSPCKVRIDSNTTRYASCEQRPCRDHVVRVRKTSAHRASNDLLLLRTYKKYDENALDMTAARL